MCILCSSDPVNAINGTHANLDGYFEKAGQGPAVVLESISTTDAVADVSIGGNITGTLASGGSELFRLDLGTDETVTIDLFGAGTDALEDTVLSIYDADGNLLGTNDDISLGGDTGSSLTFTAQDAGEIFIRVEGFADGNGIQHSGDYQLQVATANAGNLATLDTLAKQLYDDYWSQDFKWNLSDTGYQAKDGTLSFNITGYSGDSNGLSTQRQELVREAFKVYEEVLGIDFVETTDGSADFRFSDNKSGAYAGSSYGVVGGTGYISFAEVNIASNWYGSSSALDGYTFQTALHEIGHAMGLGHQGDYNGNANYSRDAKFANDSWQGSMMSYFSQQQNTAVDASYAFLLSPMAADWIALDHLYSEYGFSSANAFSGDTVYGFNTNISSSVSGSWADLASYADHTAFTIVDGGGVDTVDFSGYTQDQRVDLTVTEGSFTQATTSDIGTETANMTLAVGTVIENAITGAGNDVIIGNDADNTLDGGAGDDVLTGGAGNDHLIGGDGTDAAVFNGAFADFTFSEGSDFFEVIGEGIDRVFDSIEELIFDDQTVAYDDLVGAEPAPGQDDPAPGGQDPDPSNDDPAPTVADPDAQDDALSVTEDDTLTANLFDDNGSGADAHSEGEAFQVVSFSGGSVGTITLNSGADVTLLADGSLTLDTNGAYQALSVGDVATETLTYTIQSADGGTDTATVTVTIEGQNDGPTAADDTFTVTEDLGLAGHFLTDSGGGQDTDVDANDTLRVTHVEGQAIGNPIILQSGGFVIANADGSFFYSQNTAFRSLNDGETGTETFTYTVSDGNGGTDTATATVVINGKGGAQVQNGTAGDDELMGTSLGDTLYGEDGRDMLDGGADDDVLMAGAGRDKAYGGDGSDIIDGEAGRDSLYGGSGSDQINGGEDADKLYGEGDADILNGDGGRDGLYGGFGADTLNGGDDADRLFGGADADILNGGQGRDRMNGGGGDDELYGGLDNDGLDGGLGNDYLEGAEGNDRLAGKDGDDTLFGGAGNDRMDGGAGDDLIEDFEGKNSFSGRDGNDILRAGDGDDRMRGGNDDDELYAGHGDNSLNGDRGNDLLFSGDGDDRLSGGSENDLLDSGAGDDNLRGGRGEDQLFGGDGNDVLDGGSDDDLIEGGAGDDVLKGGRGVDQFVFTDAQFGNDLIRDFKDGIDLLDFSQAGLGFDDFDAVADGRNTVLTLKSDADQSIILNRFNVDDFDALDFV